jgi:hypothetical protein
LRDAALACGYRWKADLNAPEGEGASCCPINSRDGHRVTTNDGYLEPAVAGGGERDMIFIAFNHRLSIGPEPAPTCAVGASVYDVFSRGELQLASPDSEIDPVVEENVLSDARDRLRMRDAVRRLTDRASGAGRLLRLDPLGRH